MTCGSSSLPAPTSPQARYPLAGETMRAPFASQRAMFSCVFSFSNILSFMAGAITSGARVASAVVVSRSSAMPLAILAMTFAVAGAMQNTSASFASEMWWMGSDASSNRLTATSLPVSARNVVGPTNLVACSVMTTFTLRSGAVFWMPRTISQAL